MTKTLGELRRLRNVGALTSALDALRGPFGPVRSYEIIHNSPKRLTLFLELEAPVSEAEVRELGAYGFGNKLCLEFLLGQRPTADAGAVAA